MKEKGKELAVHVFKKGTELGKTVVDKGSDIGKIAVDKGKLVMQEKAEELAIISQEMNYQKQLKKYNPLFLEEYHSEDYVIPNMIQIRDDGERRDIDVCKGAIGWKGKEADVEILYLYDEAVPMSGITFVPDATCNSIYYVDRFDRKRYIKLEALFGKAHEERLAELDHIACSLGAKRCSVEISLSSNESNMQTGQGSVDSGIKGKIQGSKFFAKQKQVEQKGKMNTTYEGHDSPKEPELKWFAHDDAIKSLIKTRCENINSIKTKRLELKGSVSATMSVDMAGNIENAVGKMGFKSGFNLGEKSKNENESTLIFEIEF